MNSYSAILRRFSRNGAAGILRTVVNSDHSRMMSSTGAVSSTKSPWAWVCCPPTHYQINFYCIAKKELYSFFSNANWRCAGVRIHSVKACVIELTSAIVGSSHGWLGLYDRDSKRPLFSDPTTDRLMYLPSLRFLHKDKEADITDSVGRLILEEKGRLAFMTFGSGSGASKIAFCSPCLSYKWTPFSEGEGKGGRVIDDILHSSKHDRLFCLVGEENNQSPKLECWKVDQCEIESPPPPILEWKMDVDVGDEKKGEEKSLKYIVCDEDTGELYLVVRHVEVNKDRRKKIGLLMFSSYTTLDIHVYRIDWERREVILMEDSLNGLSIFVGMNQSFAMVASEVPGLNPDSVYFGSDDRLTRPKDSILIADKITGSGVFDYQKKTISPLFNSNLMTCQNPVWFTPRPRPISPPLGLGSRH